MNIRATTEARWKTCLSH